jgi:hypothetical protein
MPSTRPPSLVLRLAAIGSACFLLAAFSCTSDDDQGTPGSGGTASSGEGGASAGGAGGGAGGEGGNGAFTEVNHDGSRLKVHGYAFGDAPVLIESIWDSKEATNCRMMVADDGATRCLPVGAYVSMYADADCTEPLLAPYDFDCKTGPFALEGSGDACEVTLRVFDVTTTMVDPATVFYKDPDIGCFENGNPAPGRGLFKTGAARPATDFVEMTEAEAKRSDRVTARYWAGADGSYFLRDARDDELDRICAAASLGTQSACIPGPDAQLVNGYFSDPACTERAAVPLSTGGCNSPTPAFGAEYDNCGAISSVWELGAPTSMPYLLDGTGNCTESFGTNVLTVGNELTAADFEAVTFAALETGRIRARVATVGSGPIGTVQLIDTELDDVPCSPVVVPGDSLRCLPRAVDNSASPAMFGDANCQKTPLVKLSACPEKYVGSRTLGCGPASTSEIRSVGAPYNGPTFAFDGQNCTAMADSNEFHEVGPIIPFTSFAPMTAVTEP